MRAGPLSDNRIISLLNSYFVPVYSSNEDSGPQGRGPAEEKAERIRIYREAMRAPCGAGAVFAYILSSKGQVIDGMDVAHAARGNALAGMLDRAVQKLNTTAGPPVVKPVPQSRPPGHGADSLVLHLTARGFRKAFPWREFPAENWILLDRAEWMSLLPPGEVQVASSWAFNEVLAEKLLTNFYPQTEEFDSYVDRNSMKKTSLRATVVSVKGGIIQARLDGTLRMKRSFYPHQDDDNFVDATLLGWMEIDTGRRRINNFKLVTEKATYGANNPEEFGAALSSLSPQALAEYESVPRP